MKEALKEIESVCFNRDRHNVISNFKICLFKFKLKVARITQ